MNRKINAVCFALILAGTCAIAWQSCTPKHAEEANVAAQLDSTEQADINLPVVIKLPEVVLSAAEPVAESFAKKNCVRDPARELYVTGLPTLAPEDHLEWEENNDFKARKYSLIIYKVDKSGNKTELYDIHARGYIDYLSKDKQKAWISLYNDKENDYTSRYYLDGRAGTITYLSEAYLIYLSADEKYFVSWDNTIVRNYKTIGMEETLLFDVCDAKTGEKVSTLEWPLIFQGWEMTYSFTDNPSIIHVTYDPQGIEYAEAEIHLDTMTLQVIRDDTNLSYDELPAKYKMNIHP